MTPTTSSAGVVWNLNDLFSGVDDPLLKETQDQCAADAEAFAATYRGTINVPGGPTASHILAGLQALEDLYDRLVKPSVYASLLFASDTSKQEHRTLLQQVEERYTAINNQLIFFDLEWLQLSHEDAEPIIADPLLDSYRHYLRSVRRYTPHTLSEPQEQIVNEKDVTGKQAWQRFFTETVSSLSFPLEIAGKTHRLTMDETLIKMRDRDRSVRQQAHRTFYDVIGGEVQTLAFLYNTLLQDHLTMVRLRHYANPMDMRHLANEIDPTTVATMMDVVEQNHPIAQDYFSLKARLLGLPRLQIYDQYAPINQNRVTMTFAEAKEMILEAFGTFDGEFRDLAHRFFAEHWIDAEVRPGKQGGAFCSGFPPSLHPYVLCNYTDDMRDAATVAHELGHGIHFLFSSRQSLLNYYPTLPLAETASVFGEILVFEHLLPQQQDPAAKLALVCGKIEDIFATVFRQNVLTRFEQAAFEGRKQGRLAPEQLNAYWLEANGRYYGEAVELSPGYEMGWSYIPHFMHTPFYCYSYVFGELLVLALYSMYREQGASFVPRYKTLLSAGGSQTPDDLLAAIGVDTRDPLFWQRGFDELRRLVGWAHEMADAK